MIENKINSLLSDPDLLLLESLQTDSNLFETLAVSHTEMWHSAFISWLIDPNSDIGLGNFPLKRFIYSVLNHGVFSGEESNKKKTLNIGDIESFDFSDMAFATEYSFEVKGEKGRLDVYGINDSIRIIIENKVKARESGDQTQKYYDFAQENDTGQESDLFVFLSPFNDEPKCKEFIQFTYQDLCDYVIKPCVNHPKIKAGHKFILNQYLSNLRKPLKSNKIMALPNKEICEKIYHNHKEVLDEIFLSVKGQTPENKSNRSVNSYSVSINQLINEGLLSPNDKLVATNKESSYGANIVNVNGGFKFQIGEEIFDSPSSAGKHVIGRSVNGWTLWEVVSSDGNKKGTLKELRDEFLKNKES